MKICNYGSIGSAALFVGKSNLNARQASFPDFKNTTSLALNKNVNEAYKQFAFNLSPSFGQRFKDPSGNFYDADYYENGLETGKSFYSNYRWLPDRMYKECQTYIDALGIKPTDKILDYGCAKGYMVKAFRDLGIDARGFDISEYALSKAPEDVKSYLSNHFDDVEEKYDWIISKDVLEHIDKNDLPYVLERIKVNSKNSLIIVPLAKNGEYIVPNNNMDKSHKIKEPISWWAEQFELAGLKVRDVKFEMPPVKQNQTDAYPEGTAFIILESQQT